MDLCGAVTYRVPCYPEISSLQFCEVFLTLRHPTFQATCHCWGLSTWRERHQDKLVHRFIQAVLGERLAFENRIFGKDTKVVICLDEEEKGQTSEMLMEASS